MNPELLEKCLSGNATAPEMQIYQQWLEGDLEEDLSGQPAIAAGTELRLWKQIEHSNDKFERVKHRKFWISRIAAAASVVIAIVLLFHQYTKGPVVGNELSFKHNGSQPFHEKEFESLRFRLGMDSEAHLKNEHNDRIAIDFSGNMMLSNASSHDQDTDISYTTANGSKTKRTVSLRKGKTYYLAYYPFEQNNLLVIEERDLMNMPPALALNISNDFSHL